MMPPPTREPPPSSKPQRVLSCILCQQRKVKCDRNFPCANCIKFKAKCVPASLNPRRRKRRFAERDLLDRVRKYEDMLLQHKIGFEPLHAEPSTSWAEQDSDSDQPDVPTAEKAHPDAPESHDGMSNDNHPRTFWDAMKQEATQKPGNNNGNPSDEAVSDGGVKRAFDQLFPYSDNILFGSRRIAVILTTLHPDPVQIFRLWQIYINNVDPLLKVTHSPSLQGRLVEAACSLETVNPTLEALMFSIYSMAVMSLTPEECQATFAWPKSDLLAMYQYGCQQALLNCSYLRTEDPECLTAFYLSLVSIGLTTDPRSLSSMLGVAMRISSRIAIHSESSFVKCTALDAEMRRRLWWSLKVFDTRISELANHKNFTLVPTLDCATPLNVNDSDLRPELKEPPVAQSAASEAFFVVVRSELDQSVRKTNFHLAFNNPALRPATKDAQAKLISQASEMDAIENRIQEKYLRFCNPDNPLHFMTVWTTRTIIAKYRLVEYYSRYSGSLIAQTDAHRDTGLAHALDALQCDTKLMTSPIIAGFRWLVLFYFPLPAYMHILQDLEKRPGCVKAKEAWEIMSENFDARVIRLGGDIPAFSIFTRIVLPAWESCEATQAQPTEPSNIPRIVSYIRECVAREQRPSLTTTTGVTQPCDLPDVEIESLPTSIPIKFGNHGVLYDPEETLAQTGFRMPLDDSQLDWAAAAWNLG
ncbi:hypothetical protein FE257_010314 [Aspergillus nanangensis]|uniref:Zn(2)-C6 fungal-type domain-containing protein n=1 Tax=Aspergillus nanangensis TaxID=2582783 RepID=A0AAD4CIS3_ASPNN|nr:hypothetical protein FE257_010314 [Aspergillus nanangensis]